MELKVEKRDIFGKKVKRYRKEDKSPAVVYGKHMDSPISLWLDKNEFLRAYREVGETTPINLKGDHVKEMVLVHDLETHPVTDQLMHVDFLSVKADEVTNAEVPVELKGESPIEKTKEGKIDLIKDHIMVEALPNDLPNVIEIDISNIETTNDVVFVKDITLGDKITIKEDPEQPVVTVGSLTEEEPEEAETEEGEESSND